MVDILTKEQRSYCMSQIRNKNTKPELIVRKYIYAMGHRYRLHDKSVPGKPDIVFKRLRKVIFVNGCYWHRHHCRHGQSTPQTNINFWNAKFTSNIQRDRKIKHELRKSGWDILVIWECQIKTKPSMIAEKIDRFLGMKK